MRENDRFGDSSGLSSPEFSIMQKLQAEGRAKILQSQMLLVIPSEQRKEPMHHYGTNK